MVVRNVVANSEHTQPMTQNVFPIFLNDTGPCDKIKLFITWAKSKAQSE